MSGKSEMPCVCVFGRVCRVADGDQKVAALRKEANLLGVDRGDPHAAVRGEEDRAVPDGHRAGLRPAAVCERQEGVGERNSVSDEVSQRLERLPVGFVQRGLLEGAGGGDVSVEILERDVDGGQPLLAVKLVIGARCHAWPLAESTRQKLRGPVESAEEAIRASGARAGDDSPRGGGDKDVGQGPRVHELCIRPSPPPNNQHYI